MKADTATMELNLGLPPVLKPSKPMKPKLVVKSVLCGPNLQPRTEHAGGVPKVTVQYDEDGEVIGFDGVTDFDYEAVERHLAGVEAKSPESAEELRRLAIRVALPGFREMLAWSSETFIRPNDRGSLSPELSMRLKHAVIDLYFHPVLTLRQLAEQLRTQHQYLHEIWQDFSTRFGVRATWEKNHN